MNKIDINDSCPVEKIRKDSKLQLDVQQYGGFRIQKRFSISFMNDTACLEKGWSFVYSKSSKKCYCFNEDTNEKFYPTASKPPPYVQEMEASEMETSPSHPPPNNLNIHSQRHKYQSIITSNNKEKPAASPFFHRLQTLPMLAATYRKALTTTGGIERSKCRWEERNNGPHVTQLMIPKMRHSAALVLQTNWKRICAQRWKRCEIQSKRQERQTVVQCILQHRTHYIQQHETLTSLIEKYSCNILIISRNTLSVYYSYMAQLLQFQLKYATHNARCYHLRNTPMSIRALVLPVNSTCRALFFVWKKITFYAANVIQCYVRVRQAKVRFILQQKWYARHWGAIHIQCSWRNHISRQFVFHLRRDLATVVLQCAIRQHQARHAGFSLRYQYAARIYWISIVEPSAIHGAIDRIQNEAACTIQRLERGRKVRGGLRQTKLQVELQQRIHRPQRAYTAFDRHDFYTASLLFVQCFEAGYIPEEEHDLRFWSCMGISLFTVWETTGELQLLSQSRIALTSALLDAPLNDTVRFYSILVDYYLGQFKKKEHLPAELLEIVQHDVGGHPVFWKEAMLLSAMVYAQKQEWTRAIGLLERLEKQRVEDDTDIVVTADRLHISLLHLRLLLAWLCLKRQRQQDEVSIKLEKPEQVAEDIEEDAEKEIKENESVDYTALWFLAAYQLVELEPATGFYHGILSEKQASDKVQTIEIGGFLVHRRKKSSEAYFVKVHLAEHEVRSLKFTRDVSSGMYTSPKVSGKHWSMIAFLNELPPAAGIEISKGYCFSSPQKDDSSFHFSCQDWLRDPHVWYQLALELELQQVYSFALDISEECLYRIKQQSEPNPIGPHVLDSQVHFIQAKAARGLHRPVDSLVLIQKAAQCPLLPEGERNTMNAVRRIWMAPPSFLLEKQMLKKMESLVTRAYEYDVFSSSTRGQPFQSALLLQLLYNARYPGNVFFYHQLASTHGRNFREPRFESLHLKSGLVAVNSATLLLSTYSPRASSWVESALLAYQAMAYTMAIDTLSTVLDTFTSFALRGWAMWHIALSFAALEEYEKAVEKVTELLHSGDILDRLLHSQLKGTSAIDLQFVRGRWNQLAENSSLSEVDFRAVHDFQMSTVRAALEDERAYTSTYHFRAEYVTGIRVHIQSTRGLTFPSILGSHPSIQLTCQSSSIRNVEPATWTQLDPDFDETLFLPVPSAHARIEVGVLNRYKRRESVLGTCVLHMEDLLQSEHHASKWYVLTLPANLRTLGRSQSTVGSLLSSSGSLHATTREFCPRRLNRECSFLRAHRHVFPASIEIESSDGQPRIQVAVEIVMGELKKSRAIKRLLQIPFHFSQWLNASYTWEIVANRWLAGREYIVASDAFRQALKRRNHYTKIDTQVTLMVQYATTLRALGQSSEAKKWLEKALEQAEPYELSTSSIATPLNQLKYPEALFEKEVDETGSIRNCVWEENVVPADDDSDDEVEEIYYLNSKTGQLRWDKPVSYMSPPLKSVPVESHAVLVLSPALKIRLRDIKDVMEYLSLRDDEKWIEMFDEASGAYCYQSQVYMTTSLTQPKGYVMQADDTTLVAVIKLQWAIQRRQARRALSRSIRWKWRKAFHALSIIRYVSYRAERARVDRSEQERLRSLSCIKVFVHKARSLRAADVVSSDPYVILTLGTWEKTTSVRKNTCNPDWKETLYIPHSWLEQQNKADNEKDVEDDPDEDDPDEEEDGVLLRLMVMDQDEGDSQDDFLGLASIPVNALDHGNSIEAALTLRDEDGYDSPRGYGKLMVEIQWIPHPGDEYFITQKDEDDDIINSSESSLGETSIAEPVVPLPPWTIEMTSTVLLYEDALIHILEFELLNTMRFVSQLSKLHGMATEAKHTAGKTEEAELLQLRLDAVIEATYTPLEESLCTALSNLSLLQTSMVKMITVPLVEYYTTCTVQVPEHVLDFKSTLVPLSGPCSTYPEIDSFMSNTKTMLIQFTNQVHTCSELFESSMQPLDKTHLEDAWKQLDVTLTGSVKKQQPSTTSKNMKRVKSKTSLKRNSKNRRKSTTRFSR